MDLPRQRGTIFNPKSQIAKCTDSSLPLSSTGFVYFLMPLIALPGQSFVVQLSDERNMFSFNIQEFTEDQYLSCFIGFFFLISSLRRWLLVF